MTKKLKKQKIATKITILYGSIFSFALLIISIVVLGNATFINQNLTKQELMKTAQNIQDYIKNGGELSKESLNDLLEDKYVEVVIRDIQGSIEIKNTIGNYPNFLEPPNGAPMENKEETNGRIISKSGHETVIEQDHGRNFMLLERTIKTDETTYSVQVYKVISMNAKYFSMLTTTLLIIDVIGIMISFLVGKYISRLMLKPVENIRQAAERISIDDLSQRIEVPEPDDEMKELTITFNSMIEGLEESFKKQNQFISDASHELRTPISVISGYASLMNRWGKNEPEVLQESIDSIISETEHMSNLVKRLLFLARSDQKRIPVSIEEICLNDIVNEVIKEIDVLEGNREINFLEKDKVNISADPNLIKQLVWIHTENALKYTKEEGKIDFEVYDDDEYAYLAISDDGPGIAEEEAPFIFDRFYRSDKSRNKDIPGTGLGLSIAMLIATSFGGTIIVSKSKYGGAKFINKFKLSKKDDKAEGV
ncbi:MAG: ATP-binding protein [Lachnospiraceae bacterium]|nr:ATP-binding protein [Lachnospiraceae bacterium]